MKEMAARQNRRFSLINLRSSSPKSLNSVSLTPTVTVLTSCAPTVHEEPTSMPTLTQSPESAKLDASPTPSQSPLPPLPDPRTTSSALQISTTSPTLQLIPVTSSLQTLTSSSSHLHLVPTCSSTLQLLSSAGSPALQLIPATGTLRFVPSTETVQRVPASTAIQQLMTSSITSSGRTLEMVQSSGTLQMVPSSGTLQMIPSLTTIQRIPSSAVIERVPSITSQTHLVTSQKVYTASSVTFKPPEFRADEKPSSKAKAKGIVENFGLKKTIRCQHMCTHDSCFLNSSEEVQKTHLSKKEILNKYRLHIFVTVIFLITLLFMSLGWYYRDKTTQDDLNNQKVFIDPRRRILTLSDHQDEINIMVGQNLPKWQLPLHCYASKDGNPNIKECLWKSNALLRVEYFLARIPSLDESIPCYNISWETLRLPRVPYDCIDVGSALWYGPSNQSEKSFPIRGEFNYVPTPYHLHNSGVFSSAVDMYWISSSGAGLLLNGNDPLTLHWNSTVPNHLCIVSNYTGPLYGLDRQRALPHMNYTICNGPNPLTTHLIMKTLRRRHVEQKEPSDDLFMTPQWSVSGVAGQVEYGQQDVTDLISKIKLHGLNCSLLVIDGRWQRNPGNLTFDTNRFYNLTNMTEGLPSECAMALQVSPYFDYRSVRNFQHGVDNGLFVKDSGGDVPGLTRWKGGVTVAMLDVSLSTSRVWFSQRMRDMTDNVRATALRLSYGSDGWLPYKPIFSDGSISLQAIRRQMAELISSSTNNVILEHTSDSQGLPALLAVPTDIVKKDGRSCLVNAIEKALTLGLLGYPYVLADGFSESSFKSSSPELLLTANLFTRWMQMAAFFPAYKFSLPPWNFGEDTLKIARNLTRLHIDLVVKIIQGMKEDIKKGIPILRPVWWVNPGSLDLHALQVNDEFLVGDSLLVAPVLCDGMTQRSIYVPKGIWSDKLRNTLVPGPKILEAYTVEMHEIPHFERMPVYDDPRQ